MSLLLASFAQPRNCLGGAYRHRSRDEGRVGRFRSKVRSGGATSVGGFVRSGSDQLHEASQSEARAYAAVSAQRTENQLTECVTWPCRRPCKPDASRQSNATCRFNRNRLPSELHPWRLRLYSLDHQPWCRATRRGRRQDDRCQGQDRCIYEGDQKELLGSLLKHFAGIIDLEQANSQFRKVKCCQGSYYSCGNADRPFQVERLSGTFLDQKCSELVDRLRRFSNLLILPGDLVLSRSTSVSAGRSGMCTPGGPFGTFRILPKNCLIGQLSFLFSSDCSIGTTLQLPYAHSRSGWESYVHICS